MIAEIIVPALAIAGSPLLIIVLLAVLNKSPKVNRGLLFTAGWLVGLSFLNLVLLMTLEMIEISSSDGGVVFAWMRVLFGLALLFLALKKFIKWKKSEGLAEVPGWMQKIDDFSEMKIFLFGGGFAAANPKHIAFTIAGLSTIVQSTSSLIDSYAKLFSIAGLQILSPYVFIFILLSSGSILTIMLFLLIFGEKIQPVLAKINHFMIKNNLLIMAGLFLLFGVSLLKKGLEGL